MDRSRLRRLFPFGLVLALGCRASSPGPVAASEDVRGGSRLEANWVLLADGVAMPSPRPGAPFHDSLLQVNCHFVRAGDGELRCMPSDAAPELVDFKFFADDACTQELSVWGQPSGLQSLHDASTCPGRRRYWKVGAALPQGTPIFTRGYGGQCLPDTSGATQVSALVGEVDSSAFVRAQQVDAETRAGFTEVRLLAEDGSTQVLGLRAEGTTQLLQPLLAADGSWRLLPSDPLGQAAAVDFGFKHADSTCQTQAAYELSSCASTAPYTLTPALHPSACEWTRRVRTVGPRLDQVYDTTWGACSPLNTDGATGFALGSEVPASAFTAPEPLPTSGRLVRRDFAIGEGWRWLAAEVFDEALGVAVLPQLADDGVERWLPAWPQRIDLPDLGSFADDACTIPLGPAPAHPPCEAAAWYFGVADRLACPTCTRIFSPGPPYGGPVHWRGTPAGPCSPYASTTALHTLGPELPAATFVPVVSERRR